MNKNKKAFTLAELLVTLGIIGIVSALTLPGITKYKAKAHPAIRERNAILLQQNLTKLFDRANRGQEEVISTLGAMQNRDLTNGGDNNNIVRDNQNSLFGDENYCALLGLESPLTAGEESAYLSSVTLNGDYRHFANARVYSFNKSDAFIIVEPFIEQGAGENSNFNREHAVIARIFIDADGADGRNLLVNAAQTNNGDIDVYGLGNDGIIYKSTSEECQNFDGGCRK